MCLNSWMKFLYTIKFIKLCIKLVEKSCSWELQAFKTRKQIVLATVQRPFPKPPTEVYSCANCTFVLIYERYFRDLSAQTLLRLTGSCIGQNP